MPFAKNKCPPKAHGDKHNERSHEDHRSHLCISCFGKSGNLRKLTQAMEVRLLTHHPSGHQLIENNHWLPTTICVSCQNKIMRLASNPNAANTLPKPSCSLLRPPRPCTRETASDPCQCSVCQISQSTLH